MFKCSTAVYIVSTRQTMCHCGFTWIWLLEKGPNQAYFGGVIIKIFINIPSEIFEVNFSLNKRTFFFKLNEIFANDFGLSGFFKNNSLFKKGRKNAIYFSFNSQTSNYGITFKGTNDLCFMPPHMFFHACVHMYVSIF